MGTTARYATAACLCALLGLAGCEGDDGDQGPAGPPGPEGPQGPAGEPAPTAMPLEVTILHVNDHHSHIEEEDFDVDVSGLDLEATVDGGGAIEEVEALYGGYPRLVSLFRTLEGQNTNVIKLHAGDAITGTLFYSLFTGRADAEVMNQVCFDAFALGNHEFDDGDASLARFLDALNSTACVTPTLAANVVPGPDSALREGYLEPYTIVERDGQEIGIIGIDIAQKTLVSSNPDEGTDILDETSTAQQFIDELTGLGVNKIVLLTHQGYANDLAMAADLSGVDVIVGGDSHSLLGDDTFADLGFNVAGDYPTQTTDADGNPVCVAQAWEYAHLLGMLRVNFDAAGVVTGCGGQPMMPIGDGFVYEFNDDEDRELGAADAFAVRRALTAEDEIVFAQPDATTSQLVAGFAAEVDVLAEEVIGSVAEDLCLERYPGQGRSTLCDRSATYEQGSDISNVVAKAFLTVTPTADVALQNGGGVRVDVAAGDFTIADAFTLLPFSNTLVVLEATGQELIDSLEEGLANTLDAGGSSGSYPYASGLRYDVDASAAFGSRISNVEVNPRVAGSWAPIDPAATYSVVTNSFQASGGDGYETLGAILEAGDFEDTFTEYAQGFIDYVEGLAEQGMSLMKLPLDEYSTKSYINTSGCDHATTADCEGF